MKDEKMILKEVDGRGVCSLIFNRPEKHNAFNDDMIALMIKLLSEIEQNPKIRVVVLKAVGKSFSAGADLEWMKKTASFDYHENVKDALKLGEMLYLLDTISKPVIALVKGNVYGGGVGIVSCADIVICADETHFCLSEVKLGLIPALISPYVIRTIGEKAARRYFLTAERFNADKALKMGLADEVADLDNLEDEAEKFIAYFMSASPNALKHAKLLVEKQSPFFNIDDEKKFLSELIAELRGSKEGQEGMSAFLEKRCPNWVL